MGKNRKKNPMRRGLVFAALAALSASCAGAPGETVLPPPDASGAEQAPAVYTVTDYKNKALGQDMPEWARLYYDGGAAAIEASGLYEGRHVFVGRTRGNNFNALIQWIMGFDADLDFPRLAAARIEARFLLGVPFPDNEYGSFYETLVRAASDAPWTGAAKEDDFWIRRNFSSGGEEGGLLPEDWEFLILVAIEKPLFASQLEEVFKSAIPDPRPSKDQAAAAARVRERFFEGF